MRSYLSLAWKEIKAQRLTAALILIAVIMSNIMTTVIGQSIGILQAMRVRQAAGLNGDRYATFHQLSGTQASELHNDDRLTDVGDIIFLGSKELGNGLTLNIREYRGKALSAYPALGKVKGGHLPDKSGEIALSLDTLKYLGLDVMPGDMITLDLRVSVLDGSLPNYYFTANLTLTGILENSYLGYASGSVDGIVGEGTSAVLPDDYLKISTDFKTKPGVDFQGTVDSLAEKLGVDERYIQYNWLLLDAVGISYDKSETDTASGFSFMAAAFALVGALVLLAAGLVIYNILKISITKRVKEYGTLRALGGERRQIYSLVALQLLILCGIGIPVGLILGTLSAKGVLIAATGMLNPDIFMAESASELSSAISSDSVKPLMLIVSAAVTLIFAFFAAFPAARYASRVSPTVAMAGTSVKIDRKVRKSAKIRNFEAYYARLNLKRGRGRTVVTILSLVMSVTVYVALQSFTGLLDASGSVKELYSGDYSITNETTGIPAKAVEKLRADEAVEKLGTTKIKVCMPGENPPFETDIRLQSHETLQIVSVDEARLKKLAPELSAKDVRSVIDGGGCLVKNPIAMSFGSEEITQTDIRVGDRITIGGKTLDVVGLCENPVTVGSGGFVNGLQIIMNDELYSTLTGDGNYTELYPTLKDGADEKAFESRLDELTSDFPGTRWLSFRKSGEEMAESFRQIKSLCWVLIVFIGAIGVLNIINTVYSNITTRVSEIGTQRAIGMSAGGIYKTFLWEGAYYGIIASVIGSLLGYICCIFIGAAQSDVIGLVVPPVAAMVGASVISVAACLVATALPLLSVTRMNIVESIEVGE